MKTTALTSIVLAALLAASGCESKRETIHSGGYVEVDTPVVYAKLLEEPYGDIPEDSQITVVDDPYGPIIDVEIGRAYTETAEPIELTAVVTIETLHDEDLALEELLDVMDSKLDAALWELQEAREHARDVEEDLEAELAALQAENEMLSWADYHLDYHYRYVTIEVHDHHRPYAGLLTRLRRARERIARLLALNRREHEHHRERVARRRHAPTVHRTVYQAPSMTRSHAAQARRRVLTAVKRIRRKAVPARTPVRPARRTVASTPKRIETKRTKKVIRRDVPPALVARRRTEVRRAPDRTRQTEAAPRPVRAPKRAPARTREPRTRTLDRRTPRPVIAAPPSLRDRTRSKRARTNPPRRTSTPVAARKRTAAEKRTVSSKRSRAIARQAKTATEPKTPRAVRARPKDRQNGRRATIKASKPDPPKVKARSRAADATSARKKTREEAREKARRRTATAAATRVKAREVAREKARTAQAKKKTERTKRREERISKRTRRRGRKLASNVQ